MRLPILMWASYAVGLLVGMVTQFYGVSTLGHFGIGAVAGTVIGLVGVLSKRHEEH